MAIKPYEKKRLIGFISNMKKTGITAFGALDHFAKKMTQNAELKKAVEHIAKEVRKGHDVEAMLHKEKIIDDFQYAILKNSTDKNVAYNNVMHYTMKAGEADIVYIKNFIKVILVWIGCMLLLAYLFNSYEQTLTLLEEIKEDYHPNLYFKMILSSGNFLIMLSIVFGVFGVLGVAYYKASYKSSLTTHYKIFKLKALDDGFLYLKMLNGMLSSGSITVDAFELLAKYMYPLASRPIFQKIADGLKKDQDVSQYLISIGVIEDAIFTIQTARVMQDPQGGFKSAYEVTERYLYTDENQRKEYINKIDDLAFWGVNTPLLVLTFITGIVPLYLK
jgi:hypothetical protein